jgi:1,4-dihydroxy-2-naphthoate octaprenyltransferase
MDKKEFSPATLIRIAQPLKLFIGLFTYALGMGILYYLGDSISWPTAFVGSLLILAILLARSYLGAYFTYPNPIMASGVASKDPEESVKFIEVREIPRQVIMQMALAALGLGAIATILLIIQNAITISSFIIIAIGLALAIVDVLPPMQLSKKGYSEIIEAFLIANLSPALAYLLQDGTMHVLVVMLTLPLTFIYLSMRISASFEYYAYDTSHASGSLLSLTGWQRGVTINNLSVALAFLLYAVFLIFGLSWNLAWPIFLALPIGVLQIIQMARISEGAKPNWRLFRLNALGTFLFTVYLVAFTLWTN